MFMAAAEVRTAWQRAANRCLVQEDAKRAPKLACCPSSTPQNDSGSGSTTVQDYFIPNIIPNRNSMNSILSPETKWWLQMQPNLGCHKDFICKQLSSLEDEVKNDMDAVLTNGDSLSNDSSDFVAAKENSFLKPPEIVSSVFITQDAERKVKEMNTKSYSEHSLKIKRATEGCLHKEELLGQTADPFTLKRPEKTSFDIESPWAGAAKSEPWWRIADKDELSLLVSQKSLQHIENCDLPKPSQTVHVPTGKLDAGIYGANDYSDDTPSCGFDDKFFYSGVNMLHQSEKLYSQAQGHLKRKHPADQTFKDDLSRSNLLDALRHSQTRARKAEMEAQRAHDEKEHIIKLLFRQASHLFAYRQWLQMLQWQNLFLQHQLKGHPISASIPNFPVLPQMPLKGKHREGRKKHKCKICKLAVALAVGLGLAGAGLLLGWTIGCLFPQYRIAIIFGLGFSSIRIISNR